MAKSSLTGLASRTFGILPGFVPGKRRCRTRIPPVELLDLGAQPRILSEQLPDQFEQLFVIQLRGIEIEVHCVRRLHGAKAECVEQLERDEAAVHPHLQYVVDDRFELIPEFLHNDTFSLRVKYDVDV